MDLNEYLHKAPKRKKEPYPQNVLNVREPAQGTPGSIAASNTESEKPTIKARCVLCGNYRAKLYAVTESDRWVLYWDAYKKSTKKFLCKTCAKLHRPSILLSLLSGNVQVIKQLPVFDDDGNLLPSVTHEQIKLLPQFYPLSYLGDKRAIVTIVEDIELIDCRVLKLHVTDLNEYYIKAHMKQFGYIFTTTPLWYEVVRFSAPKKVQFTNYWDRNDKLRTTIIYKESKFER